MPPAGFEYLEVIGEGTSGTVYRARDPSGREVAVKLFRSQVAAEPAMLKRLRREVEIALALAHPNLVATYDGGHAASGRLFLATELMRGGDVHRLLAAAGPLAEGAALSILCDVLAGLDCLHRHALIHRDVKPENILLAEDGTAKLSDFGLARLAAPEGRHRITATGEMIGTPHYLAPEQVRGQRDVDIRADLYAAGAVLYELLAGRPPFEGRSVVEIVEAHLRAPVPDLKARRPDASDGAAALVASLLEKDRERRPADPAAAAARAAALLGDPGAARAAIAEAIAAGATATRRMSRRALRPGTLSSREKAAAPAARPPRLKLDLEAAKGRLTLFVFGGEGLLLGRDGIDRSDNDVCLRVSGPEGDAASRKIASRQVRLRLDASGASARDLDSQGGTRLDGARLRPNAEVPLRPLATLSIAGVLELETRTIRGPGGRAEALLILRPQNRSEHAYALVRERLVLGEREGAPVLGAPAGAVLAPDGRGGFAIDGVPATPGLRLAAGGLSIAVEAIRAGDMK